MDSSAGKRLGSSPRERGKPADAIYAAREERLIPA